MNSLATLLGTTVGGSAVLLGLLCGTQTRSVPNGTPSVTGLSIGLVVTGSFLIAFVLLTSAWFG